MKRPDPPGLAHPTCLAVALVKADPWQCPVCQKPMRLIAVIEDPPVVEEILRPVDRGRQDAPILLREKSPSKPGHAIECKRALPNDQHVITD